MERFVLEFAIRSSLIVLTAALVLRFLRIKIAAAQHAVWVGVLLVMLALPVWMSWGPKATLPVLPARTATRIVATDPPALRAAAPVIPAPSPAAVPLNMPGPRKVAETSEAKSPVWSWNGILIGAYLLGACTLLLRLAIGTLRVSRLTSASCVVPVTVGLLRPRIILPESSREWPQAQLDAVLTHEGSHVRRRDPLFQWLALFNRAVFWFHPLTWWLERRLSALAEEACDDAVLERGHDPREYAEYLLDLARAVQHTGTRVNALRMAMPGSYLPQRVRKMIEGVRAPRISPMRMACAAVACAIPAAVLIAGTFDPASPQQGSSATTGSPRFEVADVHRSPSATNPYTYRSGGALRGGRYDLRKATMLDLIRIAYGVDPDKVLGGPSWLELDRFDVSAKAPPSTSEETVKLMLQALLADRFKLNLHKGTRPMPALVFTVGKDKPKLKEADGSGSTGCHFESRSGDSIVSCRNVTMEGFAQSLADDWRARVLDLTGLKGSWNFELKWTPRDAIPQAGPDHVSLFDAVDKQLGLKLEVQNVPAPVIVIDRVNERPTANPPGVAQALPPRLVEFEVADIKPSRPDEKLFSKFSPGGSIEMRGYPMNILIATAWDIDWTHINKMLLGPPKWLDSKRFDIVAKTSAANGPGLGFLDDDTRLMLRALLIERFRMVTHYEDHPVVAYTLVAVKPKLRKADPSNRTSCKEAPLLPNDPRDANPMLSRLLSCQNITMTQFAKLLQGLEPGYIPNEVEDATGIEGAWDFTLNFTADYYFLLPGRGADASQSAGVVPTASDPNGALSLFDAVNKQLGLKLDMRKRTMPVLVIDHMEEKPTEN